MNGKIGPAGRQYGPEKTHHFVLLLHQDMSSRTANAEPAPVLERNALVDEILARRASGDTIVLANGCFDVFHVGHIRYLAGAGDCGGCLVVGVNSDEQVTALKGAGRPLIPEGERAELVAALRFVDYVTIFTEPTVEELIRAIRPDIHAKGTDYTPENVPERKIVAECGGRVVIVGDPKDHSSTGVISSIRANG